MLFVFFVVKEGHLFLDAPQAIIIGSITPRGLLPQGLEVTSAGLREISSHAGVRHNESGRQTFAENPFFFLGVEINFRISKKLPVTVGLGDLL